MQRMNFTFYMLNHPVVENTVHPDQLALKPADQDLHRF